MRNNLIYLMAFVVTGFGTTNAFAEIYISSSGGVVVVEDSDIDDGVDKGEYTYDSGTVFVGALGLSNEAGRVELELGYRENDFDELKGVGSSSVDLGGDITSESLMVNIYYDFETEGFYPFLGVGVGGAIIEADIDGADSEDDSVLAYQVMLGGSYTSSFGLSIDLQYRYYATGDPDFGEVDSEYRTHNLMIGLRQSF